MKRQKLAAKPSTPTPRGERTVSPISLPLPLSLSMDGLVHSLSFLSLKEIQHKAITSKWMRKACVKALSHITSVDFGDFTESDRPFVSAVTVRCRNLTRIVLGSVHRFEELQYLLHGKNIKTLTAQIINRTGSSVFTLITSKLPNIENVGLEGYFDGFSLWQLSFCSEIRCLSLRGILDIYMADGLMHIFKKCTKLKKLELWRFSGVTNVLRRFYEEKVVLEEMESLTLRFCNLSNIDTFFIKTVMKNARHIDLTPNSYQID